MLNIPVGLKTNSMKKISCILLLVILLVACKKDPKLKTVDSKSYTKIEQLHWLVGHWENKTELEQSFENWTKANDSTLVGHSFTLIGSDTVFAERVALKQLGDTMFLNVIAYQQNDDQPVTFKLSSNKDGVFTFENPEHDFPSSISYSNPVQDSIHAWIEGQVNGEFRKIDFLFKRSD